MLLAADTEGNIADVICERYILVYYVASCDMAPAIFNTMLSQNSYNALAKYIM